MWMGHHSVYYTGFAPITLPTGADYGFVALVPVKVKHKEKEGSAEEVSSEYTCFS